MLLSAGWLVLSLLGMNLLLCYHHQAFTLLVTTITLIYFARPWVYVVNNEKRKRRGQVLMFLGNELGSLLMEVRLLADK